MECQNPVWASESPGRVLVIDDAVVVRRSIRSILTGAGYDVLEAEEGTQAIELLQDAESTPPVDAILCDLRLPQIAGVELIVSLRTRYPEVPVVALTSYPDVERAVLLMRRGAMDFLLKPVLQAELLEVIRRAVGQSSARRARVLSYRELREKAERELERSAGGGC